MRSQQRNKDDACACVRRVSSAEALSAHAVLSAQGLRGRLAPPRATSSSSVLCASVWPSCRWRVAAAKMEALRFFFVRDRV